ncbi:hypothetical protein [Caulobacter sp. UNC358MFTsu5.1]|uniref:hypothetical protein n=1 Tax=Caulobacter sp. UNC358MFTsu5.1 TaxID=1449049 RepID=UPI000AA01E57|nr:hypothetical protein [Caulobacter sp. UNC358MFTsu5.1]
MRKAGFAGGVVMVVAATLAACEAPDAPAPVPARPAPTAAIDPNAMTPAEIEADRQQNLAFERDQETAPFSRWPGVARRQGDVLVVHVGGRDVASFTDTGYCDGFDQCARWRFRGVWRLGGRDYPWLTFFHGEGEEMAYLVDAAGGLVSALGDPSASPDGRWLVIANEDPDSGGGVSVFEAGPRGLRLAAASDIAACRAGAWKDNGRLAVTCAESDPAKGERLVAADLVAGEVGWRIEPRAELDAKTRQPLARPSRPLVGLDVPLILNEHPADVAYEVEKGYRLL